MQNVGILERSRLEKIKSRQDNLSGLIGTFKDKGFSGSTDFMKMVQDANDRLQVERIQRFLFSLFSDLTGLNELSLC